MVGSAHDCPQPCQGEGTRQPDFPPFQCATSVRSHLDLRNSVLQVRGPSACCAQIGTPRGCAPPDWIPHVIAVATSGGFRTQARKAAEAGRGNMVLIPCASTARGSCTLSNCSRTHGAGDGCAGGARAGSGTCRTQREQARVGAQRGLGQAASLSDDRHAPSHCLLGGAASRLLRAAACVTCSCLSKRKPAESA